MKFKDFKKMVDEVSDDFDNCEVVKQGDDEGNFYDFVSGLDPNAVKPDNERCGFSVYSTEWSADDACMEEKDWEKLKNNKKKRVIVIF